jgi:hypothetical protein
VKLRSLVLSLALASAPIPALAQDKTPSPPAKTPEQIKAEQKDKDFKKAKEDMEKELTGKKTDPQVISQATGLLQFLAYNPIGLEVKDAAAFVHQCLAKKIPLMDAQTAVTDKQRVATDAKTGKFDLKKFQVEFKKWIDAWKPAPSPAPAPGGK